LPAVKHQSGLSNVSAETESAIAFGISPEITEKISESTNGNGNDGEHFANLEAEPALGTTVGPAGERPSGPDNADRKNVLEMSSIAAIERLRRPSCLPYLRYLPRLQILPMNRLACRKIFEVPKADEPAGREIATPPLIEAKTDTDIEAEIADTQELEIPEFGEHPWNIEPVDPSQ